MHSFSNCLQTYLQMLYIILIFYNIFFNYTDFFLEIYLWNNNK